MTRYCPCTLGGVSRFGVEPSGVTFDSGIRSPASYILTKQLLSPTTSFSLLYNTLLLLKILHLTYSARAHLLTITVILFLLVIDLVFAASGQTPLLGRYLGRACLPSRKVLVTATIAAIPESLAKCLIRHSSCLTLSTRRVPKTPLPI